MAVAKLERLLDLIAALLHTERPLTASDIRERIPGYPEDRDSFKRAFERDKKDLRDMEIPIRIEPIPGTMPAEEGYRIDPDEYALPDPGLDPDELAALHLAATAVRLDGTDGRTGLYKLGGAVATIPTTDGASEVPAGVATLPAAPHLATVFEAVGQHRRLRFRYRDKDRRVDPFRLHHERGRWYLRGHDHDAGESRSFRLDRVDGDVTAAGPGSSTVEPDAQDRVAVDPWALGDDDPIVAHVAVRPPQAALAARIVGEEVPKVFTDDGTVVLELLVRRRDGFRSFVLGFLDDAVVLDPPELRADMISWLQAMVSPGADV